LKYSGTWKKKQHSGIQKQRNTLLYIDIPVFPNIPAEIRHIRIKDQAVEEVFQPWNVIFAVLEYKNDANP
jgi:hypothetical protein